MYMYIHIRVWAVPSSMIGLACRLGASFDGRLRQKFPLALCFFSSSSSAPFSAPFSQLNRHTKLTSCLFFFSFFFFAFFLFFPFLSLPFPSATFIDTVDTPQLASWACQQQQEQHALSSCCSLFSFNHHSFRSAERENLLISVCMDVGSMCVSKAPKHLRPFRLLNQYFSSPPSDQCLSYLLSDYQTFLVFSKWLFLLLLEYAFGTSF